MLREFLKDHDVYSLLAPKSRRITYPTFADRAAFDAYQTHPLHVPIRKRMHEVRSGSVACDFEI